jgi:hypothetical protein
MRRTAATLVVIALIAAPLAAKDRGRHGKKGQGIPPGHLPPTGTCRVWYDGRPPGHQPPPTGCREAESIAARDRNTRVIYGDDRGLGRRDNRSGDRDDERWGGGTDRDRAIPRRTPSGTYPSPDRDPNSRGRYGYENVPFDNGYRDGYDKGLEDARDNDRFDPTRHGRYRSGDRGYDRRYGSKEEYKSAYREGFRSGYEEAYRGGHDVYDPDRRPSGGRWPF